MIKKSITIAVSVMVLSATLLVQNASAQAGGDEQAAAKARAKVEKIGVGAKSHVEVKLQDQTKLKGYISAAGQDTFTVTDSKSGTTTNVAYAEVAQVKKPGGISALTWGIIAGSAAAAVIVGITVLHPVLCDGGAGC